MKKVYCTSITFYGKWDHYNSTASIFPITGLPLRGSDIKSNYLREPLCIAEIDEDYGILKKGTILLLDNAIRKLKANGYKYQTFQFSRISRQRN